MVWSRLYLLVLLLSARPVCAADWAESFDSIKKAASSVKSVSADFVQHKFLKILSTPIESHGRFVFRAPDSIRWEYKDPIKSVMIMNHGALSRYSFHDGKWKKDAAASVEALRVVVDEIQSWLTGNFNKSKAFRAELDSNLKRTVVMEPRQKAMAKIIQRIVLTLDDRPGCISRVEIIEGPDARTVLEFGRVEINESLDEKSFSPPR